MGPPPPLPCPPPRPTVRCATHSLTSEPGLILRWWSVVPRVPWVPQPAPCGGPLNRAERMQDPDLPCVNPPGRAGHGGPQPAPCGGSLSAALAAASSQCREAAAHYRAAWPGRSPSAPFSGSVCCGGRWLPVAASLEMALVLEGRSLGPSVLGREVHQCGTPGTVSSEGPGREEGAGRSPEARVPQRPCCSVPCPHSCLGMEGVRRVMA